jgi:sugar phosphate isomerase/epimerase
VVQTRVCITPFLFDMAELPIVGAALPVALIESHREWLFEHMRDLEIQDAFRPDLLDGDWRPVATQARTLLSGYTGRVGIHGPFEGLPLMTIDAAVRKVVTHRLLQGLEFAEVAGGTHMVVHSPWLTLGHHFVPLYPGMSMSDAIGRVHETLAPVVERAAAIGCTLVVENIFDLNPGPWMELVSSFASPFVKASVDVGHAQVMHRTGGASPDAFIRAAGAQLGHIHLQDTDGLTDRHWTPGDGNINWYAVFEAVAAGGAMPRLILELRDQTQVLRGAAYLSGRGLVR